MKSQKLLPTRLIRLQFKFLSYWKWNSKSSITEILPKVEIKIIIGTEEQNWIVDNFNFREYKIKLNDNSKQTINKKIKVLFQVCLLSILKEL